MIRKPIIAMIPILRSEIFPNNNLLIISFTQFYSTKSSKMKNKILIKTSIIYIISLLYVLLFIYAATSKILDFENFRVQLGQSPLLSAYAGFVAVAVPLLELVICCLLLIPKQRVLGLFSAYAMMVMFTAYIYIILNFSSFVPCSCGGILEQMSWNQHMIFNIAFIILSVIAVFISRPDQKLFHTILLSCSAFLSIGLVFTLFYVSENVIHHHNNFIRRFPHFPAVADKELALGSESYYFAGSSKGKLFLGNYTAPLQITEVDGNLTFQKIHNIKIDRMKLPFTAIQIKIAEPYFYLVDGNVPCIFQGEMLDWKGKYVMRGDPYFTQFIPTDSTHIAFRTILKSTRTNTLGLFNLRDTTSFRFEKKLITKQIDGVFDTDGHLMFDNKSGKLVYLYRYRNEYLVTDPYLRLLSKGNTIDTTATAQIKVAKISTSGETKLAAPPLIVNNSATVYNDLLFVCSNLPGKYESLEMWKKASIIDIYDLQTKAYLLSFYVYNIGKERMRSFYIVDDRLYALIGDSLIVYKLRKSVTENYRIKN